eukprot:c8486_g1_i1.p1 GENE.c8486_g1_i1~~c8486_g1_i1.p1  ORF type:complete len:303 (-),score=58.15 c8486_g1_i1:27-935(-)
MFRLDNEVDWDWVLATPLQELTIEENRKRLKKHLAQGIPEDLRVIVWSKLLDIERIKVKFAPHTAESLRQQALQHRHDPNNSHAHAFTCIDRDVPRTISTPCLEQDALRLFLEGFVLLDPELNYSSGMNFVARLILQLAPYKQEEYETRFWCFVALFYKPSRCQAPTLRQLSLRDYEAMQIHSAQIDELVRDKLRIDGSQCSISFTLTLFANSASWGVKNPQLQLALHIGDLFLLDGMEVLNIAVVALIEMRAEQIAKAGEDTFLETVNALNLKAWKPQDCDKNMQTVVRHISKMMDNLKKK